jgi:PKD repeat protein
VATDPEGVTLTYSWDFRDGGVATQATSSHVFATNGSFNVQVQVSDGVNTTTTNIPITVTLVGVNLAPTAMITNNVSGGPAPLTVSFSGTNSFDPEGTPLSYSWNFGDGTTATTASPAKTYNSSGIYNVALTVSDGTNVNTATTVITVGNSASGLVAAYSFDEGAGTKANDSSGNANNGTIVGASWNGAGRFGKALAFGPGSMLTVGDSASLHVTTGLTIEAWVYPTNLSASWMNVIFKPLGNPSTAGLSYVLQGSTPSMAPGVFTSPSASNLLYSSSLPLNTWSHLAATYDGSMLRFYVNGLMVATEAQSGSITNNSSEALTIGGNNYSGQNWAGMIDEVRIYNRALGQTELQTDINTPVVGTSTRPAVPQNFHVAGP